MDLDAGRWPQDGSDFLGAIGEKARLLREGHAAGVQTGVATAAGHPMRPAGLLMTGMGFSGISNNLVVDAAGPRLPMPVTLVKDYHLPDHANRDWHVLAVSYSGETEETLAVARAARARRVPVTGFCTGGPMAEVAQRWVAQPPGYQPRAALGFTWFSILGFLEATGILPTETPVRRAVAAVEAVDNACGPGVRESHNAAKRLARDLHERVPQIYATPALAGVALHFRGMLNENAKKIASVELLPECNHGDLAGWSGDPRRDQFAVVALSHGSEEPEIDRRLAFMQGRYADWGVPWHPHRLPAVDDVATHIVEQARALQFLDYVSFYTAMLRGVDPSVIEAIKGLKAYLRA